MGTLERKKLKRESIVAREVAKEVLATIGRGQIPVVKEIALKKGYKPSVAKNPQQIKKASSYQDTIKEGQHDLVKALEKERNAILKRMEKTRNKAKYRDLTYSLDVVTKNHQLLTGGSTENVGLAVLSRNLNDLIEQVKNES